MIPYNEITPGTCIVLDGQPYEVLSSNITKKSRQKASNQTKLKHLASSKVFEHAFHQSEYAEEADIAKGHITYLYTRRLPSGETEHWFCEEGNPRERFSLSDEVVGGRFAFLKPNTTVEALYFGERITSVRPPIKVALTVTEAPPSVRGNTAQGGTKQVVLETGATINVPLFINEGDIVRVNTETGEYTERVEKSK